MTGQVPSELKEGVVANSALDLPDPFDETLGG
jgi:hypothetical protein